MGLFNKIFKGDKPLNSAPVSLQFRDSDSVDDDDDDGATKGAPRRESVHVVLRDTTRLHGIPSDWMDVRVIPVASSNSRRGLHVQLIVRQGHDRLLTYVPAFQSSFLEALEKFDARAPSWLLSLSWQFENMEAHQKVMPDPRTWGGMGGAASAPVPIAEALEAMPPADPPDAEPVPAPADFVSTQDEDVERDIMALFAIRDAAMQQDVAPPAPPDGPHPDFQDTKPGA